MDKILAVVRVLAVILAVATMFVTVPYAAPILLVLGLVGAVGVPVEDGPRFFIMAVLLTVAPKAFDAIPTVGAYIDTFLTSLGLAIMGVAVGSIIKGLFVRIRGDWVKTA